MRATVLVAALLLVPAAAQAQSAFLELERTGVALEHRHVSSDFADGLDLLSGSYFLIGYHTLGRDGARIIVEIPWARIGTDEENPLTGEEFDSQSEIGNIYVGYGRRGDDGITGFDVGLRLPTNEDASAASLLGHMSSFIDRLGAYSPQTMSFIGGVEGSVAPADHTRLRFRGGITYLHYTGDADVDGSAVARLTAQSLTRVDALRLGAGLETLFFMTGTGNAGERSLIEGVLNAGYDFGPVLAGLQFRLPIDEDYQELIDHVLVLSIEATIPY